MKLTYEDLTPEEADYLTDDCGNHILDVPDFMWTESCRRHDFEYWVGHTAKDRSNADWAWLTEMLQDVNVADQHALNHGAWVYKLVAGIYFLAVRIFSAKYFYFGDRYKTREDLRLEMKDGSIQ